MKVTGDWREEEVGLSIPKEHLFDWVYVRVSVHTVVGGQKALAWSIRVDNLEERYRVAIKKEWRQALQGVIQG